jgi:hypothetical protein
VVFAPNPAKQSDQTPDQIEQRRKAEGGGADDDPENVGLLGRFDQAVMDGPRAGAKADKRQEFKGDLCKEPGNQAQSSSCADQEKVFGHAVPIGPGKSLLPVKAHVTRVNPP